MSQVFDSDLQFLDASTFDEIVMGEVELFPGPVFDEIVNTLQTWDTKSLIEIQESMLTYLKTRQGKDLKLSMNIVLDHCMEEGGRVDDFKVYLLTNTLEWLINVRDMEASGAMENTNSEQE